MFGVCLVHPLTRSAESGTRCTSAPSAWYTKAMEAQPGVVEDHPSGAVEARPALWKLTLKLRMPTMELWRLTWNKLVFLIPEQICRRHFCAILIREKMCRISFLQLKIREVFTILSTLIRIEHKSLKKTSIKAIVFNVSTEYYAFYSKCKSA